jgi:hypothetical protein
MLAGVVNLTTTASLAPNPPLLTVYISWLAQGTLITCGVNPSAVQADVSVVPPPPPPPPPLTE